MATVPTVSVIIPCYKQANYLPCALESLKGQRGVGLEIVVVDDGSPDDVQNVCASFGPQVKCIRQENRGLSGARNAGVTASKGAYLHFLDADDWVSADFHHVLAKQLDAHPDWAVAACPIVLCLDGGTVRGPVSIPPDTCRPFGLLSKSSRYTGGGILVRRSVVAQVGLFDESLRSCEDWDFWVRVARTGALFGRVEGPEFFYRIHEASMSRQADVMLDAAEVVLQRARAPDPRVAHPAKEWEKGAPTDDFDSCYGMAVSLSLGKALATGDAETAIRLLERLTQLQRGAPLTIEHYHEMRSEIALCLGCPSPDQPKVRRHCWNLLRTIDRLLPEDASLRETLPELTYGLSGAPLVAAERERWRENYQRLAKSLPVRQLLWLRRKLLRIPEPDVRQ